MKNDKVQVKFCGIDEVGRGAFAGPLVAASVSLTTEQQRKLLRKKLAIRDSKTLSEIQREYVYEVVLALEIDWNIEHISIEDINTQGIGWANTTAIRRLIEKQKNPSVGENRHLKYVVDGYFPKQKIAVPGETIDCVVDADATVLPVMLAGIMAKVTRDRIMKSLHQQFEVYKWNQNKGYGTRYHLEAIRQHGICSHHRLRFVQTALTHS